MSAFQVSPAHLASILASWASLGVRAPSMLGFDPTNADTWAPTFDRLATANAVSVGDRYREECAPVAAPARLITAAPLPPIAACKAIDCLIYQSCETPDWDGSEVARALAAVKAALVTRMPGYSDAAWSIV